MVTQRHSYNIVTKVTIAPVTMVTIAPVIMVTIAPVIILLKLLLPWIP